MRSPPSRISPLVGAKRPLIKLNSVDLPAPLGPMMATRSPGATARLAPRMISVLPKLLRRSFSSRAYVMPLAPQRLAPPAMHEPAAAKRTPRIRLCRSAGVAPSRGRPKAVGGGSHQLPALDLVLDLFLDHAPLRAEVAACHLEHRNAGDEHEGSA